MAESIIDFSSIVAGTTVRAVKIDGVYYMPRRDIIMAVCNCDMKAASDIWTRRLTDDKNELEAYMKVHQFSGTGQSATEVLAVEGCILLIMMLPGKFARSMRLKACKLVSRFINADPTLISDLEINNKRGREASCVAFVKEAFEEYNQSHKRTRTELPAVSYVYGTVSHVFPGLVKIGRTADINARLCAGNTFCAPSPHILVALAPTFDAKRDEIRAHEHFSAYRKEGEFFKVSVPEVQEYFHNHIAAVYNSDLTRFVEDIHYTKENKDSEDFMTVSDMVVMLGGVPANAEEEASLEVLVEEKFKERYGADALPGKQQVCYNGLARNVNQYGKKDHDLLKAAIATK